jgi:hypothetical protein
MRSEQIKITTNKNMAIPPTGAFEYEAEFTKEGFRESDIILHGADRTGCKEPRLVGHKPMFRFWNGRLILAASDSDRRNSSVRMISFPFGGAVSLAARTGDNLYIVRTTTGDIGLSLLRGEKLILAIGAITRVPLGNSGVEPSAHDELHEGDAVEVGDYHIYVERTWKDGIPGADECVSVCFADDSKMKIAAMRSAILLANGEQRIVEWDGTWVSA